MDGAFSTAAIQKAVVRLAAYVEPHADDLSALDGALGDGDLGVTLVRGLRSVAEQAARLPPEVGAALLQCAQAFVSISGSTFGTLLATGLMSAAKATQGRTEISWQEASALLFGAVEAMRRRGKAELGDKTVLDAVAATAEALRLVADPADLLPAAIRATEACLERFRDKPCRQGRARMFGDRSIGKDDPGMVAWLRLLEGLA
jgi:dihydroxyacetone kinase-like protein